MQWPSSETLLYDPSTWCWKLSEAAKIHEAQTGALEQRSLDSKITYVYGDIYLNLSVYFFSLSPSPKGTDIQAFFFNIRAKMIQQELCGTTRMSFVDRPLVHWFEEFINCRGGLLISC